MQVKASKTSTFIISALILSFVGWSTSSMQSNDADNVAKTKLAEYWKIFSTSWPRYVKTVQLLKELQTLFPNFIQIYSIGQSVQGREMIVIKLGNNLQKPRSVLIPQFKIVANMHGDETLGRALVLMLAVDLLINYHNNDSRARDILDSTELHLMPSMNVDGFEAAPEASCNPDPDELGRKNANYKDLNRDFPDQFLTAGQSVEELLKWRQPETQNVMKWILSNHFVLSANFHALTLVASYPFDSVSLQQMKTRGYKGSGVISKSPDHNLFFNLATLYSEAHGVMSKYNNCSRGEFKNGVVNGAEWYNVRGGMQDFNYAHSNTFEITFELSCCKFPPASTLLSEWKDNRNSIYKYIEATQWGVKGLVLDTNGKPVANAKIHVVEIDHTVTSTSNGEYWRLLLPGVYTLWVEADGYAGSGESAKIEIPERQKTPIRHDFILYQK